MSEWADNLARGALPSGRTISLPTFTEPDARSMVLLKIDARRRRQTGLDAVRSIGTNRLDERTAAGRLQPPAGWEA